MKNFLNYLLETAMKMEILGLSAPEAVILIRVTPFMWSIEYVRSLHFWFDHPIQKKKKRIETGLLCRGGFFVPLDKLFVANSFQRLKGMLDWIRVVLLTVSQFHIFGSRSYLKMCSSMHIGNGLLAHIYTCATQLIGACSTSGESRELNFQKQGNQVSRL